MGAFQSVASRDPDVLDARRASLVSEVSAPRAAGVALLVLGGVLSVTVPGPLVGIPVGGVGWWLRRRGVQNVATIEAAYREVVRRPPVTD
jgi:hypothetical protein